jgi:hypothetical protein
MQRSGEVGVGSTQFEEEVCVIEVESLKMPL